MFVEWNMSEDIWCNLCTVLTLINSYPPKSKHLFGISKREKFLFRFQLVGNSITKDRRFSGSSHVVVTFDSIRGNGKARPGMNSSFNMLSPGFHSKPIWMLIFLIIFRNCRIMLSASCMTNLNFHRALGQRRTIRRAQTFMWAPVCQSLYISRHDNFFLLQLRTEPEAVVVSFYFRPICEPKKELFA